MKKQLLTLGIMSVLAGCVTTPVPKQQAHTTPTVQKTVSKAPPLTPVPTALQSALSEVVGTAPQKHTKLKREYDIILLALLDSSKQKGDPDYLATAHKMAQTVVIPTFKPAEQKIILEHATMRYNQANYHGFYYPDFPHWLRAELKETRIISEQKQIVPMNGGENQRF